MAGQAVTVLKANTPRNIPEEELRKGDVVLVQAGDLVPADRRLVEVSGLELTGEIAPVTKKVGAEDVFLIDNLADLVTLIESARRLKTQEADVLFLRLAVVLALLLGLYGWAWLAWR